MNVKELIFQLKTQLDMGLIDENDVVVDGGLFRIDEVVSTTPGAVILTSTEVADATAYADNFDKEGYYSANMGR